MEIEKLIKHMRKEAQDYRAAARLVAPWMPLPEAPKEVTHEK